MHGAKLIKLLCLGIFVSSPTRCTGLTVKVGVAFQETGSLSWIGNGAKVTSEMWKEHLDSTGALADNNITFEIVYRDTESSMEKTRNVTRELIEDEKVDIVVCPGSAECGACAEVTESLQAVAIGFACAIVTTCPVDDDFRNSLYPCENKKPYERRFDYLNVIMTPIEQYFLSAISLAGLQGAKTIGFVGVTPFLELRSMGVEFMKQFATEYGMETVFERDVPATAENNYTFATVVEELKVLQPDMLITYPSSPDVCIKMIQVFKDLDYIPKALSILNCLGFGNVPGALGSDIAYATTPLQWDAKLTGYHYTETEEMGFNMFAKTTSNPVPSAKQFDNAYRSKTGQDSGAHYLTACAMAGFATVGAAAKTITDTSAGFDKATWARAIQSVYQPSFFGILGIGAKGVNEQKPMALVQAFPDTAKGYVNKILTPVTSSESYFVYPIPTWAERTYVQILFGTRQETIVLAICIVGIIFCLLAASAILAFRKHPLIRFTSIPFSVTTCLAPILIFLGILCCGLEVNQAMCGAQHWLLSLGFLLYLAPIVAKSFRVKMIHKRSQKLSGVAITNATVARWLLSIIAPQVLLNLAYSIASPPQATVFHVDPVRPVHDYTYCDHDPTFLTLIFVYIGLVFVATWYFCLESRKWWQEFNEIKELSNAMYVLTLSALFVVCIGLSQDRVSIYFGRAVAVVVSFVASTTILFAPKLLKVNNNSILGASGSGDRRGSSVGKSCIRCNNAQPTTCSRCAGSCATEVGFARTVVAPTTEI